MNVSVSEDYLRLNSQIIKKALKSTYNIFKEFDPKSKERNRTKEIKKKIIKKSGEICAICGKNNLKIVAAHIEPLEAGGETTEKNIILLCSKSINSVTPGCHELFDDGFTSIKQIEKLKNSSCSCECRSIREQMIELWKKRENAENSENPVQQRISKRHWGIALKLLKEEKVNTRYEESFFFIIKEAEINRKRSAKDGLKQARKLLDSLIKSIKSIPEELHSRLYYELGYIHLLCGEHDLAAEQFCLSEKCAVENIEKDSAFWLWLNAAIALQGNQFRWDIVEKKMDEIDRNRNKTNSILAGRIHVNGLFNRVRVFLIQNEFKKAKDKLDEAIEHWKNMDIESGWEKSFFPTMLLLRGQVLLSLNSKKTDAEEALKLFSRYIVIMLAGRQVPEGIRDVLFPAAKCLRIMGKNKDAEHAEITANRILDGASFMFPYKKLR